MMKWLTNMHNPSDPNALMYVVCDPDETREEAVRRHYAYLRDKVIGRPRATSTCTVEQLEKVGKVGVYTSDFDLGEISFEPLEKQYGP